MAAPKTLFPEPPGGVKPDFGDGSWYMLYPLYLDSSRTKSQGRKIGKEFSCENPGAEDIYEACKTLNVPAYIELYKAHPRTPISRIGRVRAQLKQVQEVKEGDEEVTTKKQLLRKVGKLIPTLKNYEVRKKTKAKREEDLFKNLGGQMPITNAGKKKESTGTGNKKKNRKKRK